MQIWFQEVQHLKTENVYVWKLLEAISNLKEERNDILWENRTEEFLIKQWIEYANTYILHSSISQVTSQILNVWMSNFYLKPSTLFIILFKSHINSFERLNINII